MRARAMLLLFLISRLVFVGFFSPASDAVTAPPSGIPTQAQVSSGIVERIRRVENGLLPAIVIKGQSISGMKLADRMRFYKTPGVSIAVINNGAIEWAKGYGIREAGGNDPVTAETLFQAASISKPVAAMGALRLVEQGKLSLDEDVNRKLVSWKVPDSEFTKEKKVTLRGLLSHSAGLTVHGFAGYAADATAPTLLQVLNGQTPANSAAIRVDLAPGAKWRYSGGGFTILQQLIIDITGKPFPQFMQETALRPLGMTHSTYEQPLPKNLWAQAASGHLPKGEMAKGNWHVYPEMAAAGLWTTPSDLARFAIELQKSRAGKSNKVLSQQMTTQMLTPQIGEWGLGLAVQGTGRAARFSHGGSNEGFRCQLIAYTDSGQGAVVMTNSDNGGGLAQEILLAVAKEYGWPEYTSKERVLVSVDTKIYDAYVGQYELAPGINLGITKEGEKLIGEASGQRIELFPESEDQFFAVTNDIQIKFVKDDQGRVIRLVINGATPAKKIK